VRIGLFVVSVFLVFPAVAPALDERASAEWAEDIAYFRQTLEEEHINLYHTIEKAEFERLLSDLTARLGELDRYQVVAEMMRITRMIGDGHTRFSAMGGPHSHYPFSLEWLDGKIRVLAATDEHKALVGSELVAINGMETAAVLNRIDPLVQGVENEWSLRAGYRWHLNVAELLYGAGVTADVTASEFTFTTPEGGKTTVTATALPMNEFAKKIGDRLVPGRGVFDERDFAQSDSLWLASDPQSKTAYIYFSAYPGRDGMERFAIKTADYLAAEDTRNLIVDLRDNGGGDFFVGLMLAHALIGVDNLDWASGIYVLIGPKTYSAGMANAAQYRRVLNATLVGQPTGGNPVGYQEGGGFELPHSGRHVMYSKRFYRFQDRPSGGVIPDHRVATDWASYRSGVDRVLRYTMDLIGRK
jgi:hypothetical protein